MHSSKRKEDEFLESLCGWWGEGGEGDVDNKTSGTEKKMAGSFSAFLRGWGRSSSSIKINEV